MRVLVEHDGGGIESHGRGDVIDIRARLKEGNDICGVTFDDRLVRLERIVVFKDKNCRWRAGDVIDSGEEHRHRRPELFKHPSGAPDIGFAYVACKVEVFRVDADPFVRTESELDLETQSRKEDCASHDELKIHEPAAHVNFPDTLIIE